MGPNPLKPERSYMRNKLIMIPAVFVLSLGIGLTACSSKANATSTHTPTGQPMDTQPAAVQPTVTPSPVVQQTETQPPAVQLTVTQAPTNQPTDTQAPAVQLTDTQAPAEPATIAPATPDGATLMNQRCTVCHSLARVISKQLNTDQWNQIVSRMIQHGAKLTSAEQTALVDYLAKTYGP
jgi:cytochrome c5